MSIMARQAPSTSSFTYQWTYDVFLNFRGEDTRFDFTRNLYNALNRKGIHVFIDDEGLRRGEEITLALLKAIEESRIAITIFSKNYASSTFCLDELVSILECVKEKGRLVLPVFYDVDPSEVRHQRENYEEAFAKHEKRFEDDKEKVRKWRQALNDVANLSGLPFEPGREHEYLFIERIAQEVSRRINRSPLHIADYPVGIEARVQQVISLLDLGSNEGVQMVAICGIGGIGKTTIARAVYNLIADPFNGICFIADVRENSKKRGIVHLQEMLLYEIVGEDIKLVDVSKGIPITKHRLQKKKVLLVLDDVDDQKQLQATAGGLDWFGSGSRIIITTRDKHLLARHGVEKIYEVESLNAEESLELLKWNAFRHNRVDSSYMECLKKVASYACGLPLALEAIGSNLFNKGPDDWDSALDSYRRIPLKEIQQILRVSYDTLGEHEQEIFLDIACCFKGDSLEYIRSVLYACSRCPDYAIKVLIDKSLIKIDSGCVTMHDLIQDMGREIVRHESPKEPGERTRLWFYEDILQVLEEDKGTGKIEAINLDMPGDTKVDWNGEAFKNMPNLKILIIRNACFLTGPKYLPNSLRVLDWTGYPCPSLPYNFYPKKLLILKVSKSCLKLDKQLKKFQSLSVLNFEHCEFLRSVPDLSGVPNLEHLSLEFCTNLTEVHHSIGFLHKLKGLSVKGCSYLKAFPSIRSSSLEYLDFSRCSGLQRFPEILRTVENIRGVFLDYSGIKELPLSFRNLVGLQKLRLENCNNLQEVKGISPNLRELSAGNCLHLSLESRSILLSQALGQVENLLFIIEGNEMPELPDHRTEGGSLSFWIQKKFPDMAICFAAMLESRLHRPRNVRINIQINGLDTGFTYRKKFFRLRTSQQIFLFDLQYLLTKGKLESVDLEPEWNHVKISFDSSVVVEEVRESSVNDLYGPYHYWDSRIFEEGFRVSDEEDEMSHLDFAEYEENSYNFEDEDEFEDERSYLDFAEYEENLYGMCSSEEEYFDSFSPIEFIERHGITKWSGIYVYKHKSRIEDIRFSNPNEESLPEFLEESSANPNTSAELVLHRCKWPHIDFRVIRGSTDKAGISLLLDA